MKRKFSTINSDLMLKFTIINSIHFFIFSSHSLYRCLPIARIWSILPTTCLLAFLSHAYHIPFRLNQHLVYRVISSKDQYRKSFLPTSLPSCRTRALRLWVCSSHTSSIEMKVHTLSSCLLQIGTVDCNHIFYYFPCSRLLFGTHLCTHISFYLLLWQVNERVFEELLIKLNFTSFLLYFFIFWFHYVISITHQSPHITESFWNEALV